MKTWANLLKRQLLTQYIRNGGGKLVPYIILNGIKSNAINGLLIRSLPPITKPKIRTQIEEIDGRDGDIVTPLGYSAYDKSFDIGLYGEYDVDEVIAFFDSQGTVTFSNEDDKYYNYQIIDQIDFEKLLRFKTATVTMHVQPFKYSLVDKKKSFTFPIQLLNFKDYAKTTNGITVTVKDGAITIKGTGTQATEFYVPIHPVKLALGEYTLNALSSGVSTDVCSIRLIHDSPSDINSFGGTYVTLKNNETVNISARLPENKTYNYIYFYITSGVAMDFKLDLLLKDDEPQDLVIRNNGNIVAKPKMTIYGAGTMNVKLNGTQVFVIELGNEENITIDVAGMNAYTDGILKNRLVTGDYDEFILNVGKNTINITGEVKKVDFVDFSRWI